MKWCAEMKENNIEDIWGNEVHPWVKGQVESLLFHVDKHSIGLARSSSMCPDLNGTIKQDMAFISLQHKWAIIQAYVMILHSGQLKQKCLLC